MLKYLCSVEIHSSHSGTALSDCPGAETLQRQEVLAGNLIADLTESSDLSLSCFSTKIWKEYCMSFSQSVTMKTINIIFILPGHKQSLKLIQ